MMTEISGFMLHELYKKNHAEKSEKIREFLSSNGFQPFVKAEQPQDLEGKIVAIFGGTTAYDILFFNIAGMTLHSEGYLVEGGHNISFMKLAASGNTQFRTNRGSLGIEELFLPHYIMIPLSLQYLDDPKFVNHAIFFGQYIPDGQSVTRDELGYKYKPKVNIKEKELLLSHPVLYCYIHWKIYRNKLDLNEVEKKLRHLTEGLPVQTRLKSPAGFYSRMRSRRESLKELTEVDDINGARIICPSPSVCYIVLEKVFHFFRDSLELPYVIDKIPVPKTNGFQGLILHLKYCGKPLEIQIQTENMYRNAEFGVASNYRET